MCVCVRERQTQRQTARWWGIKLNQAFLGSGKGAIFGDEANFWAQGPRLRGKLGEKVQWWVCISLWILLCLLPTHPSFSTNLHLNRDFFFF